MLFIAFRLLLRLVFIDCLAEFFNEIERQDLLFQGRSAATVRGGRQLSERGCGAERGASGKHQPKRIP